MVKKPTTNPKKRPVTEAFFNLLSDYNKCTTTTLLTAPSEPSSRSTALLTQPV